MMSSKRATTASSSSSLALILMFLALITIYLVVPQTGVVASLCVLIATITLLIGMFGNQDEIRAVTAIAAALSLVAAGFLGHAWFGTVGAVAVPSIWFMLLFWTVRRMINNTLLIPEDHAVIVAPFLSNESYRADSGYGLSSVGLLDRHVATIPLYELSQDVRVDKVNTRGYNDIDTIQAHVDYRVSEPEAAILGIPNRGKIQNDVAKELGQTLARARLDVAFWEKLLGRQMADETSNIIRERIFSEDAGIENVASAYINRNGLADHVTSQLQKAVGRWGVTILNVEFDAYAINGDALKAARQGPTSLDIELEKEKKRRKYDSEAEALRIELSGRAEAESEARRISLIISELQRLDVPITPKLLEEIAIAAIRSAADAPLESAFSDMFEASRAPKSVSAGGGNAAKKP